MFSVYIAPKSLKNVSSKNVKFNIGVIGNAGIFSLWCK